MRAIAIMDFWGEKLDSPKKYVRIPDLLVKLVARCCLGKPSAGFCDCELYNVPINNKIVIFGILFLSPQAQHRRASGFSTGCMYLV